jgi:hypothetical protein
LYAEHKGRPLYVPPTRWSKIYGVTSDKTAILITAGRISVKFLPLVCAYNSALKYAISKVRENQMALKLNGTRQLLIYADDVNLLGHSIDTIKKNTEIEFGFCLLPFSSEPFVFSPAV